MTDSFYLATLRGRNTLGILIYITDYLVVLTEWPRVCVPQRLPADISGTMSMDMATSCYLSR
jgi:hypothetical protein